MKGHKTIVKKQYVLLLLFIAVLCISACSAPASEPSSSNNVSEGSTLNLNEYVSELEPEVKTVSLERLVEYYDSQLDPEIPKITVSARIYGEGYAVDCNLPYDAILITNNQKSEMDKNRTWFVNLMNNFWSLPRIQDGMHQMSVPAHFTITFTELPTDKILVVDNIIQNENGIPDPHVIDGKPGLSKQNLKEHSRTFMLQENQISFDLWPYAGVEYFSTLPNLRGLQLQCNYSGTLVDYYILFQTDYGAGFPPDTNFSHLTPLEE